MPGIAVHLALTEACRSLVDLGDRGIFAGGHPVDHAAAGAADLQTGQAFDFAPVDGAGDILVAGDELRADLARAADRFGDGKAVAFTHLIGRHAAGTGRGGVDRFGGDGVGDHGFITHDVDAVVDGLNFRL